MLYFIVSMLLAIGLSYLKIHAFIKISWLMIVGIVLLWGLAAAIAGIVSVLFLVLVLVLGVAVFVLVAGAIALPFVGIGFLIYWVWNRK